MAAVLTGGNCGISMGVITRIPNTFVLVVLMLMSLVFSLAYACVCVDAYQLMPLKMIDKIFR